MTDIGPDNRRRYARLDLALTVSYRITGGSDLVVQDPREALSSDISMSGLRLMTPTELPIGSTLELLIALEGYEGEPVHAAGEVVWQNKLADTTFETGVIISQMPDTDRSRFMQFVFDQMSKIVTPLAPTGAAPTRTC